MFDSLLPVYALVFAAALLVVDSVLRFVLNNRRAAKDVRNRLEALKQTKGTEDAFQELLLRRGVNFGNKRNLAKALEQFYARSGLNLSVPRRVLYFIGLTAGGYGLIYVFLVADPVIAGVGGLLSAIVVAFSIIWTARAMRIRKFTDQMPQAIDIIVRSLNAGHPLNAALSLVAREMPDPLGSEFGILTDQMTFGAGLEESMQVMIDRVGVPELRLLATTFSVQQGTGGNLSEILVNLAQTIRARMMLRAKIRAISAEGRFTMWVVLLFPFVLFIMIRALQPKYFDPVWESGHAGLWIAGCLLAMGIGAIVIRRIVNFDY